MDGARKMLLQRKSEENQRKRCETCAYHDDWTHACFNPDSDDRADFTDNEHICKCWTSREE